MVLGYQCAQPRVDLTQADLMEAIRRIKNDFAFFGLTDYYTETVCLFHRMFGGIVESQEFLNNRYVPTVWTLIVDVTVIVLFLLGHQRQRLFQ